MIQIQNLSKSFGAETLFRQLNLSINENEKIGLIGPNGSGKTTLIQLIAKLQEPDTGSVIYTAQDLSIAYLPQQVSAPEGQTIAAYLELPTTDIDAAYQELARLSENILIQEDAYQSLLENIQTSEWLLESMQPIQTALNLADVHMYQPVEHLSSGQKTRLGLMRIALNPAKVILLDEPTNHLDQAGRIWLIHWIKQSQAAMLTISHDRDFVDQVAEKIWYLDKEKDELIPFEGNYSAYKAYEHQKQEKLSRTYELQREEIQQLQQAVKITRSHAVKKKGGKGDSGDKFAKGFFNDRTTHMIKKTKQLEKRIHELEENLVSPVEKDWLLSIRFEEIIRSGDRVIAGQHLEFGYPGNVVVRCGHLEIRYRDRIVLTGLNGSGKTTLLQTLSGQLSPLSGTLYNGQGVQRGYLTQEQKDMPGSMTAIQYLQLAKPSHETTVRNFLARYLFTQDKVHQTIGTLSNGEKKRLALAGLVYSGCNLLFLDEPLNHLDIPSREQIQAALQMFVGTIVVVEHDPYFIRTFPNLHWHIEDKKIQIEKRS